MKKRNAIWTSLIGFMFLSLPQAYGVGENPSDHAYSGNQLQCKREIKNTPAVARASVVKRAKKSSAQQASSKET